MNGQLSLFDKLSLTKEARRALAKYFDDLEQKIDSYLPEERAELTTNIEEHVYSALEEKIATARTKRLDAQAIMEILTSLGEPEDYLEGKEEQLIDQPGVPGSHEQRRKIWHFYGQFARGLIRFLAVTLLIFLGTSSFVWFCWWLINPAYLGFVISALGWGTPVVTLVILIWSVLGVDELTSWLSLPGKLARGLMTTAKVGVVLVGLIVGLTVVFNNIDAEQVLTTSAPALSTLVVSPSDEVFIGDIVIRGDPLSSTVAVEADVHAH